MFGGQNTGASGLFINQTAGGASNGHVSPALTPGKYAWAIDSFSNFNFLFFFSFP